MAEELIKDSLGLHFNFLNPPEFYRNVCFRAVQWVLCGILWESSLFLAAEPTETNLTS